MDRMACVNLPAFPLQLLLRRHPDWEKCPVVVVDNDKPQGIVLWVNQQALRRAVLPGMRYAKGLSLAPDLRAGVVSEPEVTRQVEALTETLRFFTPEVEPSPPEPGVFWLNASGLSLLYPSLKKWAGLMGSELSRARLQWTVAVGFSRYATRATAKTSHGIVVFENPSEERAHVRSLPIARVDFPPDLRDALLQLAITTLGGFVDLPEDGIRKRFGNDGYQLYKVARDELFSPLASKLPREPFADTVLLDHPETHIERLMAVIATQLDPILIKLQKKATVLASIILSLGLDNGEKRIERLRPASPTIHAQEILKLIELRLHAISLVSGVVEMTLEAEPAPAPHKQLELFARKPRRDLEAAERAFARLRAEFGDHVVTRARLRDGHLPEARYEWEPMDKLPEPAPAKVTVRSLVRRIFSRSIALPSSALYTGDGRPPAREDSLGPYIVSGGWWRRRVHREYFFVRSPQGQWLWIYHDQRRKQTFVQGTIE
jgi:protein ImuB